MQEMIAHDFLQSEYCIFNSLSIGVIQLALDEDFTVLFINDKGYELLGYTKEQFKQKIGTKALNLVYEQDHAYTVNMLETLRDTNQLKTYQHRIVTYDGSIVWTNGSGVVLCDHEGTKTALISYVDITNLMQLEAELAMKSAKMENIFNHIHAGIIKCDLAGDLPILFINNRALDILGYSSEQFHEELGDSLGRFIQLRQTEILQMTVDTLQRLQCPVQFEAKIAKRDGQIIWIAGYGVALDSETVARAGLFTIHDVTLDNHMQQQLIVKNDSLRISERRYQIAMKESDIIVFEYVPRESRMIHAESVTAKFGTEIQFENIPESLIQAGLVHPEDTDAFRDLFTNINRNKKWARATIRLFDSAGALSWNEISLNRISDDFGVSLSVIGVIKDITSNKINEMSLLQKANMDSLTGLYNKAVTRSLIETFLLDEGRLGKHVFFIIDIDNFKGVNDNLGHIFGDAVLIEIAGQIKRLFRPNDIIGRIGGDEFVVFIKNCSDPDFVSKKATQICNVFRKTFVGEKQAYKISGSIGICIYNGQTYEQLYASADKALYLAKNRGKDQFALYDENDLAMQAMLASKGQFSNVRAIEQHGNKMSYAQEIMSYVFDVLYNAKDIRGSVSLILAMLGQRFGIDRVYIFENSFDNRYTSNTYEWCNQGIVPMIDQLQQVPLEEMGDFFSNYNANNVFYSEDINNLDEHLSAFLQEQGIVSMLHVGIKENGVFKAFIGFDECSKKRQFTDEEVDTLGLVGQIVGLFILKKQMSDERLQALNNNIAIMNSMQNFLYVIEPTTFHLMYLNKKTHTLVPTAKVGDTCFTAFFGGRTQPCLKCPAMGIKEGMESCTLEIYNEILNVWTEATASKVPWANPNGGVLLCCNDITRYKSQSAHGELR